MTRIVPLLLASTLLCAKQAPNDPYPECLRLAQDKLWADARACFTAGMSHTPHDIRYPLQLAGIAFLEDDFRTVKQHLGRARHLDPNHPYANNFLATIFALEENLDAALRYWNRAGKPILGGMSHPAALQTRLDLVDSAFAFPPAGLLQRRDYLLTKTRLGHLDVFRNFRLQLTPRPSGDQFDAAYVASELSGWGGNGWSRYLVPLRGAAFQTVLLDYHNVKGSTVNARALLRWDPLKQRAEFELSAPALGDAALRQRFLLDLRRESWDLSGTTAHPFSDLLLRRAAARYELRGVGGPQWTWWTGFGLSWRNLPRSASTDPIFTAGLSPFVHAGVDGVILGIPERRFVLHASASAETGRLIRSTHSPFARSDAALRARWLPKARGEDLALRASVRAGGSLGGLPFDEFYILGIERDTALWLRGHPGTRNGKKGSAPLGRHYLLASAEWDKTVYQGALASLTVGPLFDIGRTWDPRSGFGSHRWLADAGFQIRLRVLSGVEISFSWARDLRGRKNAFYSFLGQNPSLARH